MMGKESEYGVHFDVYITGAKKALLNDTKYIKDVLRKVVKHCSLTTLQEIYHKSPNCFMAVLMLRESHLAAYVYPRTREVEMCLQTCRSHEVSKGNLEKLLKKLLNTQSVNIRRFR